MSKRKQKDKEQHISCIVYLSSDGDMRFAEQREMRQLRYIKEYAKAHNIDIAMVLHRDVMGQVVINHHFEGMVSMIRQGVADGILVANMSAISSSIPDAFAKVGKVYAVGGQMVTVDEGRLGMNVIKEAVYGYNR